MIRTERCKTKLVADLNNNSRTWHKHKNNTKNLFLLLKTVPQTLQKYFYYPHKVCLSKFNITFKLRKTLLSFKLTCMYYINAMLVKYCRIEPNSILNFT